MDGTTTATITGGTLSEIISGDDAVLMSTGNFNDKNAGTGKTPGRLLPLFLT